MYIAVYMLNEVDAAIKSARYSNEWTKREEIADGLAIFLAPGVQGSLAAAMDMSAVELCLNRRTAGSAVMTAAGNAMLAAYDAQVRWGLGQGGVEGGERPCLSHPVG